MMKEQFQWQAKATGDMTLAVINERNERILTVDMLSYNTMKAGTNGDILVRAFNNLTLLSKIPFILCGECDIIQLKEIIPYSDAGISPLPWSVRYESKKRFLKIMDSHNKKIAEKKYSSKIDLNYINTIITVLIDGVKVISETFKNF